MSADFEIAESSRYGAALTVGSVSSYHHHSGRYQLQLSGHGFEANHFLSEDDLRELRDWIDEELPRDLSSYKEIISGALHQAASGGAVGLSDHEIEEIADGLLTSLTEAR